MDCEAKDESRVAAEKVRALNFLFSNFVSLSGGGMQMTQVKAGV